MFDVTLVQIVAQYIVGKRRQTLFGPTLFEQTLF